MKTFPNFYSGISTLYGITQEPTTNNYALVLKLEDSDLRFYLKQNHELLRWENRLYIMKCICLGLKSIHSRDLIHKDLHMGNILHSDSNGQSFTYISDFGFCMPANENYSEKIYGVIPYMAPEILLGKPYTKESDIYSLGIIINEIISIIRPFNEELCENNKFKLTCGICCGKRPKIREETPEALKELIEKCWDEKPESRPSIDEISALINYLYPKKFKELSYNFIEETIADSTSKINLSSEEQFSNYSSQLIDFRNLPEPVNSQNQEEFVSCTNINR